eukprot:2705869-Amphidinium_carterae.1
MRFSLEVFFLRLPNRRMLCSKATCLDYLATIWMNMPTMQVTTNLLSSLTLTCCGVLIRVLRNALIQLMP